MISKEQQYRQELKKIDQEYSDVVDRHYNEKLRHWCGNFIASEWTYYKEFKASHKYKKWMDGSVTSYLNFLISRSRNLKLKIDRERYKKFNNESNYNTGT
jgi:hypothetical protein